MKNIKRASSCLLKERGTKKKKRMGDNDNLPTDLPDVDLEADKTPPSIPTQKPKSKSNPSLIETTIPKETGLLYVALCIALVALILGAIALGFYANQSSNPSGNVSIQLFASGAPVTIGNTGPNSNIVLFNGTSRTFFPPLDDGDGGIGSVVPITCTVQRLYVTLSNLTINSSGTTPVVTATIYRAAEGTMTWVASDVNCSVTTSESTSYYEMSALPTSILNVSPGDRLALVLTAGSSSTNIDTVTVSVGAGYYFVTSPV
jgi:hypothetical protein